MSEWEYYDDEEDFGTEASGSEPGSASEAGSGSEVEFPRDPLTDKGSRFWITLSAFLGFLWTGAAMAIMPSKLFEKFPILEQFNEIMEGYTFSYENMQASYLSTFLVSFLMYTFEFLALLFGGGLLMAKLNLFLGFFLNAGPIAVLVFYMMDTNKFSLDTAVDDLIKLFTDDFWTDHSFLVQGNLFMWLFTTLTHLFTLNRFAKYKHANRSGCPCEPCKYTKSMTED